MNEAHVVRRRVIRRMAAKLRLASQDFRDLRFVSDTERWGLVSWVLSIANKAVSEAMRNGALLEFPPNTPDGRGSGSKMPLNDSPFNRLVGYFEVKDCPELQGHSRLFPGKMFDEYESIYVGDLAQVGETYDVSELHRKHLFVLLGYWSDACGQIANWLDGELDDELDMETNGEGEEAAKPLLRGPIQQRLVDVLWEGASWFDGKGELDGRELCKGVWPEKCVDSGELERIYQKLLPKTISVTNDSLSIPGGRSQWQIRQDEGNVIVECVEVG